MATRNRRSRTNRSERGSRRGKSRRGGFKYQKRSADNYNKRSDQSGNRDNFLSDTYDIFTPAADKTNTIRLLPPTWDDAEHYAVDAHVHYGIGADESAYLCLRKMKNEPCPICEEAEQARNDNEEEYADKLKTTLRPVSAILDREAKDPDKVLLYAMPWTLDRDISAQCVDKTTGEVLPIDDPYEGYDVSFYRKGKGMKTKYTQLSVSRHESEAADDIDEILETLQETGVPDCFVYYDYDYISEVFHGKSGKKDRGRGGDKEEGPDYSWEEIHDMDIEDLEDFIDDEKLDIDTADFDEDELPDVVCEELGIDKPKREGRRSRRDKEDDEEMDGMRSRRRNRTSSRRR